ncbi:hypothetical protein [Micromonospora sp. NPDC005652]|uniref:hypothetical protein n=1 Tax=Micromonospora sp. NPDC005652 TaxID=3157046 RepID=UPI0033CFF39A
MAGQAFSGYTNAATEQVALWVLNDSEQFTRRPLLARAGAGVESFTRYLRSEITMARRGSAPWQVRQALSSSDLDGVDWSAVRADVLEQAGLRDAG